MYCPKCGTDASPNVQYCRACGANLKVIGKAVALSEAIARSDRGPLPKIREMVKGLTVDQVTDEVSHALERMNKEIARISPEKPTMKKSFMGFRKKTPEERREQQITKGIVSLFSGVGLTIFLYYLSAAMVLKLPPNIIAQVPFEIDPVVRMIWLFGLIPTLTGVGHILAGLMIRPNRYQLPPMEQRPVNDVEFPKSNPGVTSAMSSIPGSVTEHTTELLEEKSVQ
jgi:hypothetical protein